MTTLTTSRYRLLGTAARRGGRRSMLPDSRCLQSSRPFLFVRPVPWLSQGRRWAFLLCILSFVFCLWVVKCCEAFLLQDAGKGVEGGGLGFVFLCLYRGRYVKLLAHGADLGTDDFVYLPVLAEDVNYAYSE